MEKFPVRSPECGSSFHFLPIRGCFVCSVCECNPGSSTQSNPKMVNRGFPLKPKNAPISRFSLPTKIFMVFTNEESPSSLVRGKQSLQFYYLILFLKDVFTLVCLGSQADYL